jgi:hypothetical protein
MRYVVDGRDDYGYDTGDGVDPPFSVFDTDAQDHVLNGLRYRWIAVLFCWLFNWRAHPWR